LAQRINSHQTAACAEKPNCGIISDILDVSILAWLLSGILSFLSLRSSLCVGGGQNGRILWTNVCQLQILFAQNDVRSWELGINFLGDHVHHNCVQADGFWIVHESMVIDLFHQSCWGCYSHCFFHAVSSPEKVTRQRSLNIVRFLEEQGQSLEEHLLLRGLPPHRATTLF